MRSGRPHPILKQVSGRSSGSFRRKDGAIISPAFFIHFIGVVHNDEEIKKFQIVQKDYDYMVLRMVPTEGFRLREWSQRDVLVEHIRNVMGQDCRVEFSVEDDIEKTPTGKHLYTVCHLENG